MGRITRDILPAGTVVRLNIFKEKYEDIMNVLIVKRFVVENPEDKKYYEYEGFLLPLGTKDGKNILFNNEQIKEVLHTGYTDKIEEEFLEGSEKMILQEKYRKKRF